MATFKEVKRGYEAQVCVNRVRKSKTLPTLKQAEKWAEQVERELREGVAATDGGKLPIQTLLLRYQRETQGQWSRAKAAAVKRLQSDMTLSVDKMTPQAVRSWAMNRKRYGMGVTRIDLKTLAGALRYANVAWFANYDVSGIHTALASLEASGQMPPVAKRDRRITDDELRLIRECWKSNRVSFDIIEFLVACPIRGAEACKLEWSDVSGKIIRIRDRKDPRNKHRVDRVPLLGKSHDILMAQTGERPFPYRQGGVSDAFRAAARRAGLDDVRLHDLRHEGISRMAEAGYTIPQISLVSGHKDWVVLRRYTHVTAESLLSTS